MDDENNLLAPPSEDELSDILSAPTEDELGSIESSTSSMPSEASSIGLGLGTAGAIRAGQKGLEIATEKLPELSQELAYKAIGGTSTPTGRDFVKKESKDFLDTAFLDTKDIGKRVLDEKMLGTLGLSGSKKQAEFANLLAEKDILDKQKLMGKAEAAGAKVSSQDLLDQFSKIQPNLSPLEEIEEINQLQKKLEELQSEPKTHTLKETEQAKSIAQEKAYNKKTKSERNVLEKGSAKAYKESSEQAIKKSLGEEALDKFKQLKGKSGETQIIRDIAAEKLAQSRLAPDLSISELGIGGLISPKAALAYRALKEKGAGIAARATEVGGDVLTGAADLAKKVPGARTAWKMAPVAGGLLAAGAEAKAGYEADGGKEALIRGAGSLDPTGATSMALEARELPEEERTASIEEKVQGGLDFAKALTPPQFQPALALAKKAAQYTTTPAIEKYSQVLKGFLDNKKESLEPSKESVKDSAEKNPVTPTLRNPEALQGILNQYQQLKGSSKSIDTYGQQLEKYAQTNDPQEKGRIEYSLAQQPAFKDLLNRSKSVAPELIRRHETFQPEMYDDGAGHQTVGYGHKLTPEEIQSGQFKNISEEQAQELMYKDLEKTQGLIKSKVPNFDQLPQNQKDAIMSYVFNAGNNAFINKDNAPTKFLQNLQSGNMDDAISEMDIVKSGDQVMPGLIKRRAQEQYLARRKVK